MIVIGIANVTLVLGAHQVFRALSWEIQEGQRIGLIGPNGAGKSSLLRMLSDEYGEEYQPEPGGMVTRARRAGNREVTVGYLPQHPELPADQTAYALALQGQPKLATLAHDLEQVEASLGDPQVYGNPKRLARALDQQQHLLEAYQALGGEQYPQHVRDLLLGLGLPESDLDKPLGVLSGGQKKLVGLARLILAQPSVLLLDEPDNHLDLPGKAYLEKLIQGYPGAVVIVSHDRYLLDAVATHIAEIEDGRLTAFAGDYSSYVVDKERRLLRQEEQFRVQQREISRLQAAAKRYAIWGKVYDNEDFARRAKAIQARIERIDRIEQPVLERRRMELKLAGWRGSNKVLEFKGVSKAYGERALFQDFSQTVWHGERVGVIGPNGAGKSVLLRLALGAELPDSGEVVVGPSVRPGHYAQEHETLDFNSTLLDTVRRTAALSESAAVAFLLRYLFTYRQVTQRIADLSGGERSRLQLALLVLSGANFLLLDEPTNNLDIASAEVLEEALAEFVGAVLVISHDRYFLDRTVDRLLVVGEGQIRAFEGGYSDYLEQAGGDTAPIPR